MSRMDRMNSAERHELERLLATLCDDALSDVETQRLNELLRGSGEARRLYLQYVDMHAGLMHHRRLASFVDLPAEAPVGHTSELIAETSAIVPASRVSRRWIPYLATAAATLAASLVFQLVWNRAPEPNDEVVLQSVSGAVPQYVATLVPRDDCGWNDGVFRREGMRLLPGPLSLHCGTAVVRFDGGAELELEGPIELNVDDIGAATLLQGKVSFRSDESAETFRLNTPWSQMLDYGTEYAVVVAGNSEELHVFDGEVVRIPKENPNTAALAVSVPAGQAWQFLSAVDATRRSVPLDAERLRARTAAAPSESQDVDEGISAYEAFNYDSLAKAADAATRGAGFTGGWRFDNPRQNVFHKSTGMNRSERSDSAGDAVSASAYGIMYRPLAKPISLDVDGVHYFSFLVRSDESPSEGPCDVKFSLRNQDETRYQHKLSTTISWSGGSASLCWEGAGRKSSLPLEVQRAYLVVGKIVASRDQPDQVFVRLFSPCQSVPSQEPSGWTVTSRPVIASTSFDAVQFQIDTLTPISVDELRIGTTWNAVARAYDGSHAAGESSK